MIRIITDSASDFTPEVSRQYNVDVAALTVTFGQETLKSGIEITNEEYYKRLMESDTLPKTAQVNPYEFEELYRKYIDAGDEIISIHISSKLSGTYQSAVIAKDSIGSDKIHVIDTKNVCSAEGLLVIIAAQMRDKGASAQEIVDAIYSYLPKLRLYIVLDTLDYLKKGGRISPAVAFLGGALGLHPVVTVNENGEVDIVGKVRGKNAALKWLRERFNTNPKNPELPMLVGHADALDKGEALKQLLEQDGYKDILDDVCIGAIVGTYSGPDAVGTFYIEK